MSDMPTEEETLSLFSDIAEQLQQQFGHSPSRAVELIDIFGRSKETTSLDDGTEQEYLEWIHHDGPEQMAQYIHFFFAAGDQPNLRYGDFKSWQQTLREAEREKWRKFLEERKLQT